jgi:ATP-dependent Clp protease ATP-binding subunit ClpC
VGKTELAKQLARHLGNEFIRYDMSEYAEKHSVARLIGAPPGYVGFDQGGLLVDAVRQHPYAVVLLDEIEKAHPEVFNILLQILEDGQLTDAKGRRVDFRNTIVIMTSNVGAQQLQRDSSIGFRAGGDEAAVASAEHDRMKDKVLGELKNLFRPEFLNRIDATVVFHSLTREEIRSIVDLQLARVLEQVAAQQMELTVTDAAKDAIIAKGFDQAFGARPLRREIQTLIEDPLAERLLQAEFGAGDKIVVDADAEGNVTIAKKSARKQPVKVGS